MKKIIEEASLYVMHTYNRFPIVFKKGRGMKIWSVDGKEYLDFVGGIAVNILGHCHEKVVIAIQKQAQRLLHTSNLYHIEHQVKLAKLLCSNSFADKAFFCNSGAEANEAAIKLARKYAKEHHSDKKFEIITAYNSFHGRTLATVTATGQEKFQKGFEPLMPGFSYVPFNNIEALEQAVSDKTCAVMLEPIQGEGGVRMPTDDYLKKVRQICNDSGALMILDEVQTGIGRTGKLFAYEHYGIEPDIMTLAKGLGGGMAIGAMLAKDKVSASFQPGNHASTFGGNPLACVAAIATLEVILDDWIMLNNSIRMSNYLFERFGQLKDAYPEKIIDVRGKGLLIAVELTIDGTPIVKSCMEKGVLINCTAGNVLRFMPALIVDRKDIDMLIDVLDEALEKGAF